MYFFPVPTAVLLSRPIRDMKSGIPNDIMIIKTKACYYIPADFYH